MNNAVLFVFSTRNQNRPIINKFLKFLSLKTSYLLPAILSPYRNRNTHQIPKIPLIPPQAELIKIEAFLGFPIRVQKVSLSLLYSTKFTSRLNRFLLPKARRKTRQKGKETIKRQKEESSMDRNYDGGKISIRNGTNTLQF